MEFADKVVIVSAAAGAGIGQGVAKAFAEKGASVIITDIHEKRCCSVAEDISRLTKAKVIASPGDVANLQDDERAVKLALDSFGRVDILVNSAGLSYDAKSVAEMPIETWDRVMDVNLKGAFYFCKAVVPTMIAQQYGRIINIGSPAAWAGTADEGAAYACAKAGVFALTRVLAAEVGKFGITVNAIAPAAIWNEFYERQGWRERWDKVVVPTILVGRLGTPADVANAILFLASEKSSFITGEIVSVTGGRMVHAG